MSDTRDFHFTDYQPYDFANRRHIGPSPSEMTEMLKVVGYRSLDALIDATVPSTIRQREPLAWGAALTEREALDRLRETANKNQAADLADRPGLLRHHHPAGHPAQHSGKPPPGTRPTRPTSRKSARAALRRS